jgi:hypothetical protein
MADASKATIAEIKDFFQADGGRPVTAKEIMGLKKDNGVERPDYDQVARGIKDASFDYDHVPGQVEAARLLDHVSTS